MDTLMDIYSFPLGCRTRTGRLEISDGVLKALKRIVGEEAKMSFINLHSRRFQRFEILQRLLRQVEWYEFSFKTMFLVISQYSCRNANGKLFFLLSRQNLFSQQRGESSLNSLALYPKEYRAAVEHIFALSTGEEEAEA